MDVERTLLSITMTYIKHSCMDAQTLEGIKTLVKDSTDRRAIQIFNNGTWYDTMNDYFLRKDAVSIMKEIKVYIGKESYKVDLDNLLGLEIETLDKITYSTAKRYEMFIDAVEVAVEDCTGNPVNIVDEYSYKLAIADLVNIINDDNKIIESEEKAMKNNKIEVTKKDELIKAYPSLTEVICDIFDWADEGDCDYTIENNTLTLFGYCSGAPCEWDIDITTGNIIRDYNAERDCDDEEVEENNKNEMEETIMNTNTTNNKEEKVMINMNAATQEMMAKLNQAKENIKVNAGETAEEYIERVDDSLNVVKGAFGSVLDVVDTALGFSAFKESILEIIEAGQTGTSKHDLFAMAKDCREKTDKYIQKLIKLGNPDKAQKLKELFEDMQGESIFTKFFSTVYWMGKKIARKLRKWFQVDEEKTVIGAICRSLAGFAGVLRAGAKLVWNTAKFAVSFIAAGVIAIADIIVKAIMTVVSKIKEWGAKKLQSLDDDDDLDLFEEEVILEEYDDED